LKINPIKNTCHFILAGLLVVIAFLASVQPVLADGIRVSVNAPPAVTMGDNFTVSILIDSVSNLNSFQLDLSYDRSVIQVMGEEGGSGVTNGLIDNTTIPIDMWGFPPSGQQSKIRILGRIAGLGAASGQGYLTHVKFQTVGSIGQSTDLVLSKVKLLDTQMEYMDPIDISNGRVTIFDLAIRTYNLPQATQGAAYQANLEASGGQSLYHWTASGLPSGLELSDSGQITGTPTSNGSYPITLLVTDSFVTANTATLEVVLKVAPPLRIVTASLAEAWTNIYYSTQLTASGGKNSYYWSASGLPSGMTISKTNGEISGTPAISGNFNIIVTVTDSSDPVNVTNSPLSLPVRLSGDIDQDGNLDMRDVMFVERIILLRTPIVARADVNNDNRVNLVDVVWIEIFILKQN
jgi:hypothetical protein